MGKHYKSIIGYLWLNACWLLRTLFWVLFLISFAFTFGLLSGLFKQIVGLEKEDVAIAVTLGATTIISLILWVIFFYVHRNLLAKGKGALLMEYLSSLREKGMLSEGDFLKEKMSILEKK